jgi:hypothetical protein
MSSDTAVWWCSMTDDPEPIGRFVAIDSSEFDEPRQLTEYFEQCPLLTGLVIKDIPTYGLSLGRESVT